MSQQLCAWIMCNGLARGQRCPRRPRTGEYCSEHKKSVIRRDARPIHNLESMNVTPAAPAAPKPPREPKTKSSVYQLTINFQKAFSSLTPEEREARKSFIQQSLMDIDHVRGYLYNPDESSGVSAEHPLDQSLISSIEAEFYPETGERFDKFHYHGLIKVIHRTKVLFDKALLIRDAKAAGFGTIHINIKGGRDEAGDYLAYARKKQQDSVAAEPAVEPEPAEPAEPEQPRIRQLPPRKRRSRARATTTTDADDLAYLKSRIKIN